MGNMVLSVFDFIVEILKKNIAEIYMFFVILILGFIVSKILSFILARFLMKINLDEFLENYKFKEAVFNVNLIELIRVLTFWYIFLLFLTFDFKIIDLEDFYRFFYNLVSIYLTKFYYGIFLIIIGFWLAYLVKDRIESEGFLFSNFIGKLVYYILIYMIIVSTLPNFGIDNRIFLDAFKYLIIGISLGIGLAIGIGVGLLLKNYLESEFKKL